MSPLPLFSVKLVNDLRINLITLFHSQKMDILAIDDPGAAPWLNQQLPRVHLLIGDSVARDSGLESRRQGDVFLRRACGSATWGSVHDVLPDIVSDWSREVEDRGAVRGVAVIWLTGNDVYSKSSGLPSYSNSTLETIADHAIDVTLDLMPLAEQVVVLGPLPRPDGEVMNNRWERTAAYKLDRLLKRQLPTGVVCVHSLGRLLLRKYHQRYSVTPECDEWFRDDRIHPAASGYAKLEEAERFPAWLRLAAAHE